MSHMFVIIEKPEKIYKSSRQQIFLSRHFVRCILIVNISVLKFNQEFAKHWAFYYKIVKGDFWKVMVGLPKASDIFLQNNSLLLNCTTTYFIEGYYMYDTALIIILL